MPEWGNLDILAACGASDPGSNPGSGVIIKFHIRIVQIQAFPLSARTYIRGPMI